MFTVSIADFGARVKTIKLYEKCNHSRTDNVWHLYKNFLILHLTILQFDVYFRKKIVQHFAIKKLAVLANL